MDYGGVRRVKLLTSVPPPPPAPGGRSSFDPLTGDLEGRSTAYQGSLYSPPPAGPLPASAGLTIEKHIYFALCILGSLFWIGALLMLGQDPTATPTVLGNPHMGEYNMYRGIAQFTIIFGVAVGMFFNWYALYGPAVWAKWTCLGCAGLGLILTVIGLLTGAGMMATFSQMSSLYGPGPMFIQFVTGIVQIAVQLWFISIIYRDIQRLQGVSEY